MPNPFLFYYFSCGHETIFLLQISATFILVRFEVVIEFLVKTEVILQVYWKYWG